MGRERAKVKENSQDPPSMPTKMQLTYGVQKLKAFYFHGIMRTSKCLILSRASTCTGKSDGGAVIQ
jgi:hypothetical protein